MLMMSMPATLQLRPSPPTWICSIGGGQQAYRIRIMTIVQEIETATKQAVMISNTYLPLPHMPVNGRGRERNQGGMTSQQYLT